MKRRHTNNVVESYRALKELEAELAEKEQKKINEQASKRENFMKGYYMIQEIHKNREIKRTQLFEAARDEVFSKIIKAIYLTALEASTLTDDGIILGEDMVDNWISERGGASKILAPVANKTYLLAKITQLVEDGAKEIVADIESEDDDTEEKKDAAVDKAKEFIQAADKDEIKDFISDIIDNVQDKSEDDGKEQAESDGEPVEDTDDAADSVEETEPADTEDETSKEPEDKNIDTEVEVDGDEPAEPDEEIDDEDPAGDAAPETDEEVPAEPDEVTDEEVPDAAEDEGGEDSDLDDVEMDDTEEIEDDEELEDSEDNDGETPEEEVEDLDDDEIDMDTEVEDDEEIDDDDDVLELDDDEEMDDIEDDEEDIEDEEDDEDDEIDDIEDDLEEEEDLGEPLDDDGVDSDITVDGDIDNSGKVFDDLDQEEDVQKAIEIIRTRVADAEETFIRNNAEDKKKIEELLDKISNNVKTVEDLEDKNPKKAKVAQEAAMEQKRKMNEITNNRPLTLFERMARIATKTIVANESVRPKFLNENGELDVDLVVERAKVMYGFLETLNTLQIENVNSKYIANVLNNEMK